MAPANELEMQGVRGRMHVYRWDAQSPRFVAVLVHGYAEHAGRYRHREKPRRVGAFFESGRPGSNGDVQLGEVDARESRRP
jgi:alpha-beta hydrolase superfamily lysophospholipase